MVASALRSGIAHWPRLTAAVHAFLTPLVLLAARFWLAKVFWAAAQARWTNLPQQLFLFESVHPLPLLPPLVWMSLTVGAETVLPVLLTLGLGTRFAALGILAMTAVIQFYLGHFLQSDFAMTSDFNNPEHYLWMLLALLLIAQGAGRWGLDRPIYRRLHPVT
jgi:putative oxidoreductase